MAIVFKIDNVDKSDLINFDFLEIQNNLYSEADLCYFVYEKFGSRTYVPAGGDEIGVWDGAIKIFGGKITNVKVRIEGKVLVYEVECKDWVDQLDGELVTESYESMTVNAIIADLQSKYATTFDITNVNCTTNIEAIYFDLKPMSKCLNELAEIAGYHWYVDPDKKIYFFAEGSIASPFDITDTNGKCLTQSLEIEEDYEQIKNRVNIQGGNIANVQVSNAGSIASYGEHEIVIRDDTLTSTAEATQKANAVLNAYKDPVKKGVFLTYDAGLVAGQKININSSLRGVNQDFIIESIKFTARTPTDFDYKVKVMTQQDNGIIELFKQEILKPSAPIAFGNSDFVCNVKFSIVDYNEISWTAGTITMSDGKVYSIALGSRVFTNSEICYFKPSTSETVLQFSTTFGDGTGDDRIALGYAIPNANPAEGAQFIPKGFMGGVRFWGGENIVARTIIAQQIGLEALTSDLVTTGEFITLSAQIKDAVIKNVHVGEKITVGNTDADVTADNAQPVSWLTDAGAMAYEDLVGLAKLDTTIIVGGYIKTSLLTASNIITGTLNASVVNVTNLDADNITAGTLTGRKVRTSAGTARVEMDESTNSLKVYYNNLLWMEIKEGYTTFLHNGNIRGYIQPLSGGGIRIAGRTTSVAVLDLISTGVNIGYLAPPGGQTMDLGNSVVGFDNLYIDDIYSGSTWVMSFDGANEVEVANRDFLPAGDNSKTCGRYNQRWSDIRTVLINGSDYGFENNWYLTENDRMGIKEKGIAVLNSKNELKLFIGENGLYVKGGNIKNLDLLPYVKTTLDQRRKMDAYPETRKRTEDQEMLELPDTKNAKIGGSAYDEVIKILKKNKEIKKPRKVGKIETIKK